MLNDPEAHLVHSNVAPRRKSFQRRDLTLRKYLDIETFFLLLYYYTVGEY